MQTIADISKAFGRPYMATPVEVDGVVVMTPVPEEYWVDYGILVRDYGVNNQAFLKMVADLSQELLASDDCYWKTLRDTTACALENSLFILFRIVINGMTREDEPAFLEEFDYQDNPTWKRSLAFARAHVGDF